MSPSVLTRFCPTVFLFSLSSFIGSFLIFAIQPLTAKAILPMLGGTSGIWAASMMFFQGALCVGYLLAHLGASAKHRRSLSAVLVIALSIPLLIFPPILPSILLGSVEVSTASPIASVLQLLSFSVGLHYILLSTMSPTLQNWHSRLYPTQSPYFLFSWSNLGASVALLSYPFLIETQLDLNSQLGYWITLERIYICGLIALAIVVLWQKIAEQAPAVAPLATDTSHSIPLSSLIWWLLLPCLSSAALVSGTISMTTEIAPMPLLWLLPLALYLATFIICFLGESRYHRTFWILVLVLTIPFHYSRGLILLPIKLIAITACSMICHGELYARRPEKEGLTKFYLAMSFGSSIGSIIISLVLPLLLNSDHDYLWITTIICAIGFMFHAMHSTKSDQSIVIPGEASSATTKKLPLRVILEPAVILILGLALYRPTTAIVSDRNFYGTLAVADTKSKDGTLRQLINGQTYHGSQWLENPLEPVSYFSTKSAYAAVIRHLQGAEATSRPVSVGAIGLGIGTIAAYGREGDHIDFIEINPNVIVLAQQYFSYLRDSKATISYHIGDGRMVIEAYKEPKEYDAIFLDAFNSDAVPVHLLTIEAIELYLKHIKVNGFLLVHISNNYLNLAPVLAEAAKRFDLHGVQAIAGGTESAYVVLTRKSEILQSVVFHPDATIIPLQKLTPVVWTDSFSSLFQVMKMDAILQ